MKILIDTNILISAILNPNGLPYLAYKKAVTYPNKGIICEQNVLELNEIFHRKFPTKIQFLETFLSLASTSLTVVPIPKLPEKSEKQIRDIKDRPILRAAISSNVDILLTGDKDFLESNIKHPLPLTASEFLTL